MLPKNILHVRLPFLDGEISSAEMLVVFGHTGRTLSQEFHASQTFCPQFCWGRRTHTQSHSSANHKKSEQTAYPWSLVALIPLRKEGKRICLQMKGSNKYPNTHA